MALLRVQAFNKVFEGFEFYNVTIEDDLAQPDGSHEVTAMAKVSTSKPKDGELALPGDYKSWPRFLSEVQRPDAKQVRELYINPAGAKTSRGQAFPSGTVMVMELYKKAQLEGETPVTGVDGKLVKGNLAKVFVMGKGDGWGQDVPEPLRNGAWVFSAYGPDGKSLAEDFTKCRAGHAPLAQKDFVPRYDEYFDTRKGM